MRLIDLTGMRFGKLVVKERGSSLNGQPRWVTECECGSTKEVLGYNLRHGHSKSCGCEQRTASARYAYKRIGKTAGDKNGRTIKARAKHGDAYVPTKEKAFKRCAGRYYTAKRAGIPIEFSSAHEFTTYCLSIAPTHCPILGIKLEYGDGPFLPNSFSIDKIDPALGYRKGNIQIISMRANILKRDATPEEILKLAAWAERWTTGS